MTPEETMREFGVFTVEGGNARRSDRPPAATPPPPVEIFPDCIECGARVWDGLPLCTRCYVANKL